MVTDDSGLDTYTNIQLKGKFPHVKFKDPRTIIKKEAYTDLKGKEKFKYAFNSDEWLKMKKPLNIIWDEVHFIADSRNSQTQMNKVTSEFVSMARRIIGFDKYGFGDFIFIAQRLGTIDVRIRELITTIIYHILQWIVDCEHCSFSAFWDSEKPNLKYCPACGERKLVRSNFISERYFFKSIDDLNFWQIMGMKTYFKRDHVWDIDDYFDKYSTLQYLRYD